MVSSRRKPPTGVAALVVSTILGMAACSGGAGSNSGPSLAVTVRDFRIQSSSTSVAAGSLVINVKDEGPSTHELVLVKTDLSVDELPLRPDGLTVDEDSPLLTHIDELGDIDVGDSDRLEVRLPPGRYVLFCNLEGHYLGGMHLAFLVVDGHGGGG